MLNRNLDKRRSYGRCHGHFVTAYVNVCTLLNPGPNDLALFRNQVLNVNLFGLVARPCERQGIEGSVLSK